MQLMTSPGSFVHYIGSKDILLPNPMLLMKNFTIQQ